MRPDRIDSVEDIFDRSRRSKSFIMMLKFAKFTESVVDSQVDIHTTSRISKAEVMELPESIRSIFEAGKENRTSI